MNHISSEPETSSKPEQIVKKRKTARTLAAIAAVGAGISLSACSTAEATPTACIAEIQGGQTVWEIASDATDQVTERTDATMAQIALNNPQIESLGNVRPGLELNLDQTQCDNIDRSSDGTVVIIGEKE